MRLAVPLEIDPAAMDSWRPGAPVVELAGETMGTTWHVHVAAPPVFSAAGLTAAIEARLEHILAQMSHWRANSALGRFNRSRAGQWICLTPDFAKVYEAALVVADRSNGAFDAGIGELVEMWGFGANPAPFPPDDATLAAACQRAGTRHLAYEPETRRLRQSGGVHLDFSGIAKGFGVDALGDVLRQHHCHHALIEIGGELLGLGMRPDADPWWVDLETPADGVSPLRIALHQLAVATSGDYVQGFHTISPRTHKPVTHAMAVSVLHESAMFADAWATALSVETEDAMKSLAIRERLAVRAILRDKTGHSEWISPALAALMAEP